MHVMKRKPMPPYTVNKTNNYLSPQII